MPAAIVSCRILEFIMAVEKLGSVRVDLLGGTIDLPPINVILPDVVTLNIAAGLRASVNLSETDEKGVRFVSKDYATERFFPAADFTPEGLRSWRFEQFEFVARLVHHFGISSGIKVELSSGSPPGAGLGGSSSMGVTLYSALCDWTKKPIKGDEGKQLAIRRTQGIESIILDKGPAGYQDYFPALYGGILALKARPGEVEVEQLYSSKVASVIESHLTLVYSGQTRLSGINNWEVYKAFFDKTGPAREGLTKIAALASEAYKAIKEGKGSDLVRLIGAEGDERERLFPNILTPEMRALGVQVKHNFKGAGQKVCGAGGGGCFLLSHAPGDAHGVRQLVERSGMKVLELKVSPPLA